MFNIDTQEWDKKCIPCGWYNCLCHTGYADKLKATGKKYAAYLKNQTPKKERAKKALNWEVKFG